MKKTSFFFLLFTSLSSHSNDKFTVGVDYINIEQKVPARATVVDASVSGLVITVGYPVKLNDKLVLTPELSYGRGTSADKRNNLPATSRLDDIVYFADIELDYIAKLSTKISYQVTPKAWIFVSPTVYYTNFTINTFGREFSDVDNSSLGADFGGEINIIDKWTAQAAYGVHQDNKFWSLGIRYQF